MYTQIAINRNFDYYYLYIENEFLMDKDFGEKIYELNAGLYNEINFSVNLPLPGDAKNEGKESKLIIPFHYKYVKLFYETGFENGLSLCFLDYNISDKSNLWEIYVSDQLEFALFGCKREINELFKKIFKPYTNISLTEKYDSINDARINPKEFTDYLEKHFKITLNSL